MSSSMESIEVKRNIKVSMRDGVELSTDIYSPATEGPFPVLLLRTIYDKSADNAVTWIPEFVSRGYVVVVQDCRGKYASDGEWEAYVHEAEDGYDCQEWIGAQSWCDGGIGMYGASYNGFTQSLTAPLRSKYLKAPVPTVSQQDNFGHWYVNGALQLHVPTTCLILWARAIGDDPDLTDSHQITRRLPLLSIGEGVLDSSFIKDAIRHNTFDDFWKNYSMRYKYHEVETPALLLHGESDHRCPISQSEEYFTALKRLGKKVEMVRFPGCSHLFPRLGKPYMREAYLQYALEWFDQYI